ncbi:MAG: HAMP domain-containing histidine kinase [Microthrixaceae bacterium]|nr:HAMP domain-containing histidine kinase [Microthrixaceae bacterium]
MKARWARRAASSVRLRVTAAAAVAVVVVLVGVGVSLVAVEDVLIDNLDHTLRLRADQIEVQLDSGSLSPGANRDGEVGWFQVVGDGGSVLSSSANVAGDAAFVPPERTAAGGSTSRDVFGSVRGFPLDDDVFRVLTRAVVLADGTTARLHVGASADPAAEAATAVRERWVRTAPVVVVALAVVVWVLVGRTLRPIERLRRDVEDLADPRGRVAVPTSRDEVYRLARTLNRLLERLETGAARRRGFVADASHELRGPLARLRAELDASDASPPEVIEEVEHLRRLVDDLLDLARFDDGSAPRLETPVDLDDIVFEVVARRGSVKDRIDTSNVSAGQVRGDRRQLERLVANLVENAARHARSRVGVSLREEGGSVELAVSDDGPGIAPADRTRVFERFARLDGARSADSGGVGLGLAIVWEVAHGHGGTVEVDPDHTEGARLVVRLPAAG